MSTVYVSSMEGRAPKYEAFFLFFIFKFLSPQFWDSFLDVSLTDPFLAGTL